MAFCNSKKNFGWGDKMGYAGKNALQDYYNEGHFGSLRSDVDRWEQFVSFAKEEGTRDLERVDLQALVEKYADSVAERVISDKIKISYAQNLISSVNRTIAAMRGDFKIWVSPADKVGSRTQVRTEAPGSMDRTVVAAAAGAMREAGYDRAAVVLEMARDFGVRLREASLADLTRWQREADSFGKINVQEGAKGGRDAPRWVEVGPQQRATLAKAIAAMPTGSRNNNLLKPSERYVDFARNRNEIDQARSILHQYGIKGYHDARAAFACQRYRELTGRDPTVVSGARPSAAEKNSDELARLQIARELGHNRIDVTAAYLGGR